MQIEKIEIIIILDRKFVKSDDHLDRTKATGKIFKLIFVQCYQLYMNNLATLIILNELINYMTGNANLK